MARSNHEYRRSKKGKGKPRPHRGAGPRGPLREIRSTMHQCTLDEEEDDFPEPEDTLAENDDETAP